MHQRITRVRPQTVLFVLVWTALVVLAASGTAHAQLVRLREPIQELFLGHTVYTEEQEELQCTLSPRFLSQSDAKGWGLNLEFEYGITNRLELGVEVSHLQNALSDNIPDPDFSKMGAEVSYLLMQKDEPFAMKVSAEISAPIGSGTDKSLRFEPSIVLAKTFGQNQLHLSLAEEFGGSEAEFEYCASVLMPAGHWTPVFEAGGKIFDGPSSFYFSPGVYYSLGDGLECGIGMPIGLTSSSDRYRIVMNVTFEF